MSSPTPGKTSLGLDANIAGLLCNIPACCGIGLIFSIVAAIVEKESKFVRFYAFQSILLHAVGIVVYIACAGVSLVLTLMVHIPLIGFAIWLLEIGLLVALVGVAILLMIKANAGEEYELPVIGEMARKWA